MSDTNYTYAVASIRVLELSLFSAATMEQLLSCGTEAQCLQFLQEKGLGRHGTPLNADAILRREREKTWETVSSASGGSLRPGRSLPAESLPQSQGRR